MNVDHGEWSGLEIAKVRMVKAANILWSCFACPLNSPDEWYIVQRTKNVFYLAGMKKFLDFSNYVKESSCISLTSILKGFEIGWKPLIRCFCSLLRPRMHITISQILCVDWIAQDSETEGVTWEASCEVIWKCLRVVAFEAERLIWLIFKPNFNLLYFEQAHCDLHSQSYPTLCQCFKICLYFLHMCSWSILNYFIFHTTHYLPCLGSQIGRACCLWNRSHGLKSGKRVRLSVTFSWECLLCRELAKLLTNSGQIWVCLAVGLR